MKRWEISTRSERERGGVNPHRWCREDDMLVVGSWMVKHDLKQMLISSKHIAGVMTTTRLPRRMGLLKSAGEGDNEDGLPRRVDGRL